MSRRETLEARGGLDGWGVVVFGGAADLHSRQVSPTRGTSFEGSAFSSEDYGGLRTKERQEQQTTSCLLGQQGINQ